MAGLGASQPEDDGLKWFGEGFDGFPKRLPDDCVEYIIHAIDERIVDVATSRSRLNDIRKAALDLEKELLSTYIWQRDDFKIKIHPDVASGDSSQATPCLKGRTNFGDSAADEWLIVYILLELSKKCQDAWIRVYDTDGEFLLIEAANALPKWLNPDIAENRVWISNGHLRIIPLDEKSTHRNLSQDEALEFIRETPEKLTISPFIEDEAFYRLREYPSAIASSFHHSLTTIPRSLAYILQQNAAYISPAVEAFYLRDQIALKPLATKDLSTLHFPPEDFVTVSVKYTKVGFAQLRSQQFDHPPAWTGVVPRLNDAKVDMGMKLTCGFEMMLSDKQNRNKRSVREIRLLLEDVESGEEEFPADATIKGWPQTQDDEKWLDIDYNDFENELSGRKGEKNDSKKGTGFGDQGAQDNLRKMVSRFEDFLNDDKAGADGIDDDDIDDDEDDEEEEEVSDSGEDKELSFDEAEFEKAMQEMMGMPPDQVEKSGLLDEARRLALEDAEQESDMDEDEEMKKVIELMEKELKGHGALNLNGGKKEGKAASEDKPKKKVVFGPEPPPGMRDVKEKGKGKAVAIKDDDDEFPMGPGEEELSSDDEEFNDVDLGLAKNMLESFKGQVGMAGPAGNLMRAMGVNMPRDEGSDDDK